MSSTDTPPDTPAAAAPAELLVCNPVGPRWELRMDTTLKKEFYYNLDSREMLWTLPTNCIKKNVDSHGESQPVSSDTTPPTSMPSCEIEPVTQSIKNITPKCQDAIFNLVTAPVIVPPTDTDEPTEMSNLVSAIGTDYSSEYAREGKNTKNPHAPTIMPAGSATLLYIGDTNLYNIKQSGSLWSPSSETTTKIKYMIHASPAKSNNVERDITKDTISNSVMNSLILAAKNGVETIIFPFIGGELFYGALKTKVDTENVSTTGYKKYDTDQHAEVLVKGVTDFYTNFKLFGITSNPIKEIYFVTFNTAEKEIETTDKVTHQTIKVKIPEVKEHEAIQKAYDNAKAIYPNLTSVLKPSIIGNVISNAIYFSKAPNIKPNIAIVNAGNTNHGFAGGSGVADMCFAGLNDNMSYQTKLDTIKTKFIEAFNAYIANPSAASSPSKPPVTPPVTPTKPKVPLANVLTTLESQLTQDSENDAEIKTLRITLPDLSYPPNGDASVVKKNLNSAEPDIKKMIEDFENAVDGDDTKFYLGACRSIKAAYDLEMSGITGNDASANEAKMRAKLLLNLRKNSLLLKVPARWDYATMQPGKEPELTPNEMKAKYDELQQECAGLKQSGGAGYASEDAYELAKQLIPLDEKIQNDKLEKQNTLVSEIYPESEYKYIPVEIRQLETEKENGNLQFKRIQGQSSSNCGRAALLNFFGTENLLIKGDPSKSDITFDLKKARPDTNIDMSSICHLYSKCAKLFNNKYNDKDDGCPVHENYSFSVLGYTLQILGYNYNEHIHFKNGFAEYDKLQTSVKNKKILGYLVSFSELHWLCYQREKLDTDNDSFYGINSIYEEDETTAKSLRDLVDQHRKGRDYVSLYPIFKEESSNQKICSLLTLADTKDKYKKEIESNETAYKWNVLMKEVTSKIEIDNTFKTDEQKLKVMFYLFSLPGGIIDVNLKKQILNSSDQIKSNITQIFIDDTKENISKLMNVNDSGATTTKLEINIINETTDYLELVGKSTGGFYYAPNFQAKYRFYYNLNNTNTYNKNIDTAKTNYPHFIYALKKKVEAALISPSASSTGGGGFKPNHNAITNNAASKSKHNSSFKVSSSSKTKGKSHNRSHTQRVK